MKIFTHLFFSALAIIISAYLVPGVFVTLKSSIILAVVLGIINVFIKPVVKAIALPITIITLGLFSLVINASFILLADKMVNDFSVTSFWSALLFSIVLSLVNALFNRFKNDDEN